MYIKKFLEYNLINEEVGLNPMELNKPLSRTNDTLRLDILKNKLISGTEFTLNLDNSLVIINGLVINDEDVYNDDPMWVQYIHELDINSFKKGIRFIPMFISGDNRYKLSDLKKTTEFGSTGGGVNLEIQESLQCFFLYIRMNCREDLTEDNLDELYNRYIGTNSDVDPRTYSSDGTILKLNKSIQDEWFDDVWDKWANTFIKVPNVLIQEFNTEKDYTIYYTKYKGEESIYNIIKRKYKSIASKEGVKIDFNKFCPADVFLVENRQYDQIKNLIIRCTNFRTFSDILSNYFNNDGLIPISLKCIGNKNPECIVNREFSTSFKLENLYIPEYVNRGKYTEIQCHIYENERLVLDNGTPKIRKMRFRSFHGTKITNIDASVTGSSSDHGKMSLRQINHILESNELETIAYANILDLKTNRELTNEINEMQILIEENGSFNVLFSQSDKDDISDNRSALISKWQGSKLLSILVENDLDLVNVIVDKLFKYALSMENENFVSPKYIRIL